MKTGLPRQVARFVRVIVAFAVSIQSIAPAPAAIATIAASADGASSLFTPCTESVSQVSPLSARPILTRKTLASPLPKRPGAHKTVAHKRRRHVVHKPVRKRPTIAKKTLPHKARRPAWHKKTIPHRPAKGRKRPLYRKVTYASPLCIDRAPAMNAFLGDLGAPLFQPIAPEGVNPADIAPVQSPAIIPGGQTPVVSPPNITPPIVINPGGTTTPPAAPAPEPASWALMLLGFAVIGRAIRMRHSIRRRKYNPFDSQSY